MLFLVDRTLPPGSLARRRIRIAPFWMLIPIALSATAVGVAAQARPSPPAANAFVDRLNSQPPSENKAALQLRVRVDLVLVPLTVTDANGIAVTNLRKGDFELFEDKHKQAIHQVSYEDVPISIGIIFDTSRSMASKLPSAKQAVKAFLDTANVDDEFFILTFNDRPSVISDFTASPGPLLDQIVFSAGKGRTALLDAIYLGLARMQEAHYERRALLIISDGGDNHSRYTERQLRSAVRESGTLIYAIGIFDHSFPTIEELSGPALLAQLSNETGGQAYTIDDPSDLPWVATHIGRELRTQCVLSYRPSDPKVDGKWHKIKIRVQKGSQTFSVHAKKGYYAPSD